MKTLFEIWNDMPVKSDKGDVHDYLGIYERYLEPYRDTAINILEIGLFNGASLLMWEQYFSGKVYGIDCDEQPHGGLADLRPLIKEGTHNIFIGDATSEDFIENSFNGIKFDVIIEDCSHDLIQQLKLYELFKPYLNENYLYCIEDIQNIDATREVFENFFSEQKILIIDRRHVKQRFDDVLILIKDKA